jgi:hypothetical protein
MITQKALNTGTTCGELHFAPVVREKFAYGKTKGHFPELPFGQERANAVPCVNSLYHGVNQFARKIP